MSLELLKKSSVKCFPQVLVIRMSLAVFDNYSKVIGSGAFGKVYLSHNLHNEDHKVAIKVLNKVKLKGHLDAIEEEIAILMKLDHPNIVKYYETYKDDKFIYIVMEYIQGADLFDTI